MPRILADYLTPEELAAELGRSLVTLARGRLDKKGPPFIKMGNQVLYPRESIRPWLERQEPEPGLEVLERLKPKPRRSKVAILPDGKEAALRKPAPDGNEAIVRILQGIQADIAQIKCSLADGRSPSGPLPMPLSKVIQELLNLIGSQSSSLNC
jgi:hypothetical protein